MLDSKALTEIDSKIESMNAESAIENFVIVRDSLVDHKQALKLVEQEHDSVLEKLQMKLRDIADEMGVDQLSSRKFGTAFRVLKESYRIGNWDSFIEWIKEKNAYHCIEKRCAKLAIKEVHGTDGEVPPGITYHAETEMQVRRPSK